MRLVGNRCNRAPCLSDISMRAIMYNASLRRPLCNPTMADVQQGTHGAANEPIYLSTAAQRY